MTQEILKDKLNLLGKIVTQTLGDVNKLGYVAGPYTARGLIGKSKKSLEHIRYMQLTEATALLTKRFKAPLFSPITHSHHLALVRHAHLNGDWEMWKEIDTHFIAKSDYIVLVTLEGWKESVGVNAELQLAKENNLPVVTYDFKTGELGYLNLYKMMLKQLENN